MYNKCGVVKMIFKDVLCKYLDLIKCSGKELSKKSGINESTISAYRKGTKIPKYESDNLNNLIHALNLIADEKNVKIDKNKLKTNLEKYSIKDIDFNVFRDNFNEIILSLNINVANLAKYIGFDSSYISKIRKGERKPLKLNDFADAVCKYTIENYKDFDIKLGIDGNSNDDLYKFLTTKNNLDEIGINSFFEKLDSFDLNDYIKVVKFDKLIVPNVPKIFSKTKTYYGFDGYKQAQIDCLKQIAFLKSEKECFWFNNLPFEKTTEDLNFTKKYMMYLAFILKKGKTLSVIHNLDRPLSELFLGLEAWIPLYMTGQIKPYYMQDNFNDMYYHIECTSSAAVLHGECIGGNFDTCKMIVSNKKNDIDFYLNYSKELLKNATSLMNIYNADRKLEFLEFKKNDVKIENRRNILIHLPSYTISSSLLDKMLYENNISDEDKVIIENIIKKEKEYMENILKNNEVYDEIYYLSENGFRKENPILDLSSMFCDKKIYYSLETYKEHLNLIKEYKKINKNYDYKLSTTSVFKNIDIRIISNKEVIITKTNNPVTHFVINHPKLINAIMNFKVPISE